MTAATMEPPVKTEPPTNAETKKPKAPEAIPAAANDPVVPLPPLIGQPGIVWYERGDKLASPTPAVVMRRNPNNKTCDLKVDLGTNSFQKGYGMVRMAKTVRHISDPALIEHPEWRNNDGAWDWFDGIQPANHPRPVPVGGPNKPATDDVLHGI